MGKRQATTQRRELRARPTPKWLMQEKDLDRVAQARCLMVLSVLSGETPVTEAIGAAGVSRGTYYQLERRALNGMLRALVPGTKEDGGDPRPRRRIAELETKLERLQRARRRSERLLALTRRLGRGSTLSPRARRTSSTRSGRSRLRRSTKGESPRASTPMTAGGAEP